MAIRHVNLNLWEKGFPFYFSFLLCFLFMLHSCASKLKFHLNNRYIIEQWIPNEYLHFDTRQASNVSVVYINLKYRVSWNLYCKIIKCMKLRNICNMKKIKVTKIKVWKFLLIILILKFCAVLKLKKISLIKSRKPHLTI